jgi:hypothetical protein
VGLEEAEFANPFGGDAGGGEVGDAAGLKLDTDVGDVDFGREDGQADGVDFADAGLGELEDDVEVVNHEVEDDVDVESAGAEEAETVGLEEHGAVDERGEGSDGGVEAFEVADLDEAVVEAAEADELVGLLECGGDGFLDEDVDAGLDEGGGGLEVSGGRHADGGGVEVEGARGELG